jgi:hypothetical protein
MSLHPSAAENSIRRVSRTPSLQALSPRVAVGADARFASTTGISEPNLKVRRRQLVSGFFRPFHKANSVTAKDVSEAGIDPFLRLFEPIKIKVMQV